MTARKYTNRFCNAVMHAVKSLYTINRRNKNTRNPIGPAKLLQYESAEDERPEGATTP